MYVTTDRVLELDNFETKCYEMTKQLYLGLWASNKKIRPLYFLTLKVEENKVALFFLLKAPRRIYEGFFVLSKIVNFMSTFSNQKLIFWGKSIK